VSRETERRESAVQLVSREIELDYQQYSWCLGKQSEEYQQYSLCLGKQREEYQQYSWCLGKQREEYQQYSWCLGKQRRVSAIQLVPREKQRKRISDCAVDIMPLNRDGHNNNNNKKLTCKAPSLW
jgi:hypothetical protein